MSGAKLALGAVAGLVALSRARGSRTIVAPQELWKKGPVTLERVVADIQEVSETADDDHGGHYASKGNSYSFNIKVHDLPYFEDIEAKTGLSDVEIWDVISDAMQHENECIREGLHEDYDWIHKVDIAGRSGGYLVLHADEDLEDLISDLEYIEPDREFTIAGPRYSFEQIKEMKELYRTAHGRLRDLREIEKHLKLVVKGFEEHIASDEFWEHYVELHESEE
jgi:hypothetical protein